MQDLSSLPSVPRPAPALRASRPHSVPSTAPNAHDVVVPELRSPELVSGLNLQHIPFCGRRNLSDEVLRVLVQPETTASGNTVGVVSEWTDDPSPGHSVQTIIARLLGVMEVVRPR